MLSDAYPGGTWSTTSTDITLAPSGFVTVATGFTGPLTGAPITYTLPPSAGCSTDATTNISVDFSPSITGVSLPFPLSNPVCQWSQFGLAISASGSAGPYTYNLWGPLGVFGTKVDPNLSTTYWQAGGFTMSEAGSYSAQVVDYLGCASPITYGLTVSVNPAPTIYSVSAPSGQAPGDPMVLSSSDGGTNYQLVNDGIGNIGSPQSGTGSSLTFSTGGSCNCMIVATWSTNSCPSVTSYIPFCPTCRVANPNVGVSSIQTAEPLTLLPNPNNGEFALTGTADFLSSASTAKVEIIDMTGHLVLSQNALVNKGGINTRIHVADNLANGLYQVKLSTSSGSQVLRLALDR